MSLGHAAAILLTSPDAVYQFIKSAAEDAVVDEAEENKSRRLHMLLLSLGGLGLAGGMGWKLYQDYQDKQKAPSAPAPSTAWKPNPANPLNGLQQALKGSAITAPGAALLPDASPLVQTGVAVGALRGLAAVPAISRRLPRLHDTDLGGRSIDTLRRAIRDVNTTPPKSGSPPSTPPPRSWLSRMMGYGDAAKLTAERQKAVKTFVATYLSGDKGQARDRVVEALEQVREGKPSAITEFTGQKSRNAWFKDVHDHRMFNKLEKALADLPPNPLRNSQLISAPQSPTTVSPVYNAGRLAAAFNLPVYINDPRLFAQLPGVQGRGIPKAGTEAVDPSTKIKYVYHPTKETFEALRDFHRAVEGVGKVRAPNWGVRAVGRRVLAPLAMAGVASTVGELYQPVSSAWNRLFSSGEQ